MNKDQIQAVKCAYADLQGALQARNKLDVEAHDWEAHQYSIEGLEDAFNFLAQTTAQADSMNEKMNDELEEKLNEEVAQR